MKVDLYWGKDSDKFWGMNRCKMELLKGLPEDIDKKKIAYTPNNRILNFFDFLSYAPVSTIKEQRKDAITHILSQSEAHLLNFFKFKKSVVLCFDIIPLMYDYVSPMSKMKAKFAYKGMVKADHIIAISQFTKDEVVKHLNYPEEKITVAYIGVDHDLYKPIEDLEETRKKYNLSKENTYLIYVGNEEPRMNIHTLLQAVKEVKKEHPNIKLIKVGNANFPGMREKVEAWIKELDLEDNVIFTKYIPEEDMPKLYCIADAAIYLCEYAGFGLPVAESMACGTPTIAANKSSIVEVLGNGGIAVDPKDEEEVTQVIIKILNNKEFAKEISSKGIEQAKKFTWKNFVDKTVEVYHKL